MTMTSGDLSYIKVCQRGACLLSACSWAASALRLITDRDRIATMSGAINFTPDVGTLVTAARAYTEIDFRWVDEAARVTRSLPILSGTPTARCFRSIVGINSLSTLNFRRHLLIFHASSVFTSVHDINAHCIRVFVKAFHGQDSCGE